MRLGMQVAVYFWCSGLSAEPVANITIQPFYFSNIQELILLGFRIDVIALSSNLG